LVAAKLANLDIEVPTFNWPADLNSEHFVKLNPLKKVCRAYCIALAFFSVCFSKIRSDPSFLFARITVARTVITYLPGRRFVSFSRPRLFFHDARSIV
jgi:hypothetical protein